MITRRQFTQLMAGTSVVAAASVAACSNPPGTTGTSGTTLTQIVADIQTVCGFLTTWQDVAAVAVSLALSTFGAGAGATIAVEGAKKVKTMICDAVTVHVTTQTSALREAAATAGQVITVVVNGIPVTGKLTAKHPS